MKSARLRPTPSTKKARIASAELATLQKSTTEVTPASLSFAIVDDLTPALVKMAMRDASMFFNLSTSVSTIATTLSAMVTKL